MFSLKNKNQDYWDWPEDYRVIIPLIMAHFLSSFYSHSVPQLYGVDYFSDVDTAVGGGRGGQRDRVTCSRSQI